MHPQSHTGCGTTNTLTLFLYYDADATMLEQQNSTNTVPYRYKKAESFQDGLTCSGLDQFQINISRIEELTDKIISGEYKNIHNLLILKNNQLVYEKYFPEKIFAGYPESFYRDNYHRTYSVTKTVVSALIGIAIDKKYIESVNDPVFKYFPGYPQHMTKDKEGLQIKHLLTHTSGIQWDENGNDMALMGSSKDRIQFFLERSLVDQPGEQFSYCSGGLNVLGEIIEKQTGMRLDQFAYETLFVPLGISNYHWKIEPDGKLQMGSGLCLRSRDMAKIGLLFLNSGKWNENQVISEQWIKQSTEWSDEFEGSELDLLKWEYMTGDGTAYGLPSGWGNNELQWYRPENVTVENGHLVITAKKETYSGKNYTSARIRTINKGDWKYGRFEFRIKFPFGKGIWSAIWMMPTDNVYGGWAASGEIDIIEHLGHESNKVHGTLHYGGPWPQNTQSGMSNTLQEGTFADDFHLFALEWEEGIFKWFVDDSLYQTQISWYSTNSYYRLLTTT